MKSIAKVDLGKNTYFFTLQDFKDVYADIDRAKADPEYMECVLMQIIKEDLGLTWSFLQ